MSFPIFRQAFNDAEVRVNVQQIAMIYGVYADSPELPKDADPSQFARIVFSGGAFVEVRGSPKEIVDRLMPRQWVDLTEGG